MKKSILILTSAIALLSFKPNGFGDLFLDGNESMTFASQAGNHVTCKAKVNMFGFSNLTTPFVVGFYLSPDTTISTTDKLIGTYTVNPTGITTATCTLNNIDLASLSVANGTYYIGTYIDIHDNVAENGMTPEIPNNSWAFRNSGGVFKVVTFPGPDVGLQKVSWSEQIIQLQRPDGGIIIFDSSNQSLEVDLRNIEGRIVFSSQGEMISIPPQLPGVYLLSVSDGKGNTITEKILR